MNAPPYLYCPRCKSRDIKTVSMEDCWWYECNRCNHALTYEEVVEQEKAAIHMWMSKQLNFNRLYDSVIGRE